MQTDLHDSTLCDLTDTVRLGVWETNARTYLRSIICEGEPPANVHANGHKTLPPCPPE